MPVKRTNRGRRHDAIALLTKDHQTVRTLFKKLAAARTRETRQNLLLRIENELQVHTKLEEEIFYPAFTEAAQKQELHLYFESLEEHHLVDMLLPELKLSKISTEVFAAKAKVLKDLVEHHIEEEQEQMFPAARKALGALKLHTLGQRLQLRKDQLSAGMWDRALAVFNPFATQKPRKRAA